MQFANITNRFLYYISPLHRWLYAIFGISLWWRLQGVDPSGMCDWLVVCELPEPTLSSDWDPILSLPFYYLQWALFAKNYIEQRQRKHQIQIRTKPPQSGLDMFECNGLWWFMKPKFRFPDYVMFRQSTENGTVICCWLFASLETYLIRRNDLMCDVPPCRFFPCTNNVCLNFSNEFIFRNS